jgi:hypothetical protein
MDIPVLDDQHRLAGIAFRVDMGMVLLKDWFEDLGASCSRVANDSSIATSPLK